MLTEEEAQGLMEKLIFLREKMNETQHLDDVKKFKYHEALCIDKFKYLVTMRTGRYKSFSNYEDLNQEGLEALVKAMRNYDPKKGNFFWWGHKYVDTRISRSANLHTTIRYPLKVAKNNIPHKETIMPLLVEELHCPDKELELSQINHAVNSACINLTVEQKKIINLVYGFENEKPMSINKVCRLLNISRINCLKILDVAFHLIKDNIKI